jgi:hypothetical protein
VDNFEAGITTQVFQSPVLSLSTPKWAAHQYPQTPHSKT